MEDGRNAKCYFIDYQHFVNVVRYRIHLMRKAITSSEKIVLNDVFYQCPTCKSSYSSLEAQGLINFENKFICAHCSPHEDFRSAPSDKSYILKEVDKSIDAFHILLTKFDDTLNATPEHDSIFDLLAELRDKPLIRNLPSQNRRRGIAASKVVDEDVQLEIQDNIGFRRVSKDAKARADISQIVMGQEVKNIDTAFSVTFNESSSSNNNMYSNKYGNVTKLHGVNSSMNSGSLKRPYTALNSEKAFPDFLLNSRVITAQQIQAQLAPNSVAAITNTHTNIVANTVS
jgi:hypothetical protein